MLRQDPEGAFVSHEFFESISGEGVMLDPCATQAHWQNGIAERAIKTVFECAKSLHKDHDTDLETSVHQAVEAHNTVERVDGYSPTQWALHPKELGIAPDAAGIAPRLFGIAPPRVGRARSIPSCFM